MGKKRGPFFNRYWLKYIISISCISFTILTVFCVKINQQLNLKKINLLYVAFTMIF